MLATLDLSRVAGVSSSRVRIVGDDIGVISWVLHLVLHDRTIVALGHGRQPILFQESLIVLLTHEFLRSSLNLDARIVGLLVNDVGGEGRILNRLNKVRLFFLGNIFL